LAQSKWLWAICILREIIMAAKKHSGFRVKGAEMKEHRAKHHSGGKKRRKSKGRRAK
jgi:hypothetical protein